MNIIKPTKGNLGLNPEIDSSCYIVGYQSAILEVAKGNSGVAIRSVKYSFHKVTDKLRPDAPPDDETRITILLEGEWEQHFWTKGDKSDLETFKLQKEGDYLLWPPGYYHTWKPLKNSTMLTVSLFQPKFVINGSLFHPQLHMKQS